jgi:ATP phosphoribosyltransferase
MRIGIPNRSSFLHVGAMAQCLAADIVPLHEYHPARLFYRSPTSEVWLCRCDELCKHFVAGDLDVIFSGDDYATEYIRPAVYYRASYAFVTVHFALLASDPRHCTHFARIFAKYPQTAREHLEQWHVSYDRLIQVSGSSECFARSLPSSAAHDVVCTGATQRTNNLHAICRGAALGCSWFFRHDLPEPLTRVTADADLLNRLRNHYDGVLRSRDMDVRNIVRSLLSIVNICVEN